MCVWIQDSAYRTGGADSGHRPEHVRHGRKGGADLTAEHVQQQRYGISTRAHSYLLSQPER